VIAAAAGLGVAHVAGAVLAGGAAVVAGRRTWRQAVAADAHVAEIALAVRGAGRVRLLAGAVLADLVGGAVGVVDARLGAGAGVLVAVAPGRALVVARTAVAHDADRNRRDAGRLADVVAHEDRTGAGEEVGGAERAAVCGAGEGLAAGGDLLEATARQADREAELYLRRAGRRGELDRDRGGADLAAEAGRSGLLRDPSQRRSQVAVAGVGEGAEHERLVAVRGQPVGVERIRNRRDRSLAVGAGHLQVDDRVGVVLRAVGRDDDRRPVASVSDPAGQRVGVLELASLHDGHERDPLVLGVAVDQTGVAEAGREGRPEVVSPELRLHGESGGAGPDLVLPGARREGGESEQSEPCVRLHLGLRGVSWDRASSRQRAGTRSAIAQALPFGTARCHPVISWT